MAEFSPGAVGNPTGRNGKEFQAALRIAVRRADGDKTKLNKIAEAIVEKAMTGDVAAVNTVADRLDGKPTVLVAGDDEHAPIRATAVELVPVVPALHDAKD